MKKLLLLSFVVFLLAVTSAHAQSSTTNSADYKTALGIKFYPTGITIKHFITDRHALEGLAYIFNYGSRITGLYEIYGTINNAGGLKWYVGPGAHIGFYNNKYGGATSIGIDGVLGLDYKINPAPIDISLDWQPSVEFGNNFNNGFSGNWGGIGVRYTF